MRELSAIRSRILNQVLSQYDIDLTKTGGRRLMQYPVF